MENNNYVSVGNIIEQERLKRQSQIAKGVSSDVYDHIEKAYSDDLSQSFKKSENLERFERDIQSLNKAETDLLLHKIQCQMNADSDSILLKAMKSIAIQHANDLEKATYVDNAQNRKLGRVGQQYGGKSDDIDAQKSKTSKLEKELKDLMQQQHYVKVDRNHATPNSDEHKKLSSELERLDQRVDAKRKEFLDARDKLIKLQDNAQNRKSDSTGFKKYHDEDSNETWYEGQVNGKRVRVLQETVGKTDWWNAEIDGKFIKNSDGRAMTFQTPKDALDEINDTVGNNAKKELEKRKMSGKKDKVSEKDGSALMGKLMEAWELDSDHSFGERKKWENKLVETLNKMGKNAEWFNENVEAIANADTGEYDDELEELYDVNGIDDLFDLVGEIGDDTENEPVVDSSSNIGNRIISALKADQGGLNNSSAGKKAQMKIIAAAENFMKKNPKVKLSNEDLENIVGGDIDEVEEKYGELKGWNKLNDAIESYFDAE